MNRRPGWAIVGTGGISRTTAADLHLTENLDLVAVASRTIENASEFAAEFEVPRAYGDYDALLADGLLEHPLRPLADTIAVLETIDEVRRQLAARAR